MMLTPCFHLNPLVLQIFGYPTGLGALLIHKSAASHLRKVYFGGGSVDYCTAEDAWAVMSAAPAGGLSVNCAPFISGSL
jgi:molybdenum cofactor sulfurtransferase